MGRGTTKEGVVGGLFDGGEDGGEICDEGIDGLGLTGWVIAIIDGKVGLEGGVVRGKGITEVYIVVGIAVSPVDNGVGKLDQLEFVLVAVRDEVRHLVKGGEQRRAQQHDIVKVENCVHGHHRFDDIPGRYAYCGVSVTTQFR